jgi:uncharacterized protein
MISAGQQITMTPPLLSALTAGVLIIIQMALMLAVVLLRRRNRQSLGDGDVPQLLAAVRRHGNFAENAAIFIAAVSLFELLGGGHKMVMTMCAAFVVGRISHLIGLSLKKTVNPLRVGGVVITVWVGLALGSRLIELGWPALGL